jgi:hypothetical protein
MLELIVEGRLVAEAMAGIATMAAVKAPRPPIRVFVANPCRPGFERLKMIPLLSTAIET